MTPMFNGRRPFIFFIESLKERDTSRFNIKVFEDHMQAHYLIRAMSKYLEKMDKYVRQRLRMCMIHKHPTVKKVYGMCYKWNIEFFVRIGLIPSKWWFYYKMQGTYTIEKYVEYHMHRNKVDMEKRIQKFKELGIAFYTKKRLKKMDDSLSRQSVHKLNKQ